MKRKKSNRKLDVIHLDSDMRSHIQLNEIKDLFFFPLMCKRSYLKMQLPKITKTIYAYALHTATDFVQMVNQKGKENYLQKINTNTHTHNSETNGIAVNM